MKNFVYHVILTLTMVLIFITGCSEEKASSVKNPNAELEDAWRLYRWNEYGQAEKLFRQLKKKLKGNPKLYLQSLYGLALTLNQRTPNSDPAAARKLYDEVIRLAPRSGIAAWAALDKVRMDYFERRPREKLIEGYEKIVRRYPESLAAEEAFLYQQALELISMEPEKIKKVIKQLREGIPRKISSANLQYYYLMLATAYDLSDEYQNQIVAIEAYLERRRKDPDYQTGSKGRNTGQDVDYYWKIATLAEFKLGDFDLARKYYRKIIMGAAKDHRIYGIELAFKRMDRLEKKLAAELKTEAN